jgi:hypothetical protein
MRCLPMLDRKAIKRALEKAGFVFLKGGWVRKEAAPRLQDKIDRAVADAAGGVEQVKRQIGDGNA